MRNKIRFGVLGFSHVAKKSVLPALITSPFVEVLMIGSRDPETARAHTREYGSVSFGIYDEVLAHPEIDAVYISLPNSLHEKWTVRAARAGKHIWCEKPAALSYGSAQRMVKAAQENNVRLIEGFSFLFHPQHANVLSIINDGVLGKILSFEGTFIYPKPEKGNIRLDPKLGGGSYTDAAVYPIRASRMIFREEPTSISCSLIIDPDTGVDAKANIELTYPDARIARISSGFDDNYQSNYSVNGSLARLSTERAYAVPPDREVHLYLESPVSTKNITIPPADQFALLINDFCKQILLGVDSEKKYEQDLLLQARVLEAGIRSHTENRTVQLSEIH